MRTMRYLLSLPLLAFTLTACTSSWHKERADAEAYGAIEGKAGQVPGMSRDVTIDRSRAVMLENFPVASTLPADFLGLEADSEIGARVISLDNA
ncbi:MAG: hypothetical protein ACRER5_08285, partial [Pseudomonas sp.]